MFARTLGLAIVGASLCVFGLVVGGEVNAKDKKFEIPKNAIAGTVKSVDLKASKFTITLTDGKQRTFSVDDKTEFWGPKGGDRGTGAKGLKDDALRQKKYCNLLQKTDGDSRIAPFTATSKMRTMSLARFLTALSRNFAGGTLRNADTFTGKP